MFQLHKNIQTDFPGQIFLELFQFKTQSLFWDTLYRFALFDTLKFVIHYFQFVNFIHF